MSQEEIDDMISAHILKLSPQGAYEFYCRMLDRDADDPKPSALIEELICDGKDLDFLINRNIEAIEHFGLPQEVAQQFVRGIMWRIEQEAAK